MFKELGDFEDIDRIMDSNEFNINRAKNKILTGNDIYTFKTHNGFVLDEFGHIKNIHYRVDGSYCYISSMHLFSVNAGSVRSSNLCPSNISIGLVNISSIPISYAEYIIIRDSSNCDICCIISSEIGVDMTDRYLIDRSNGLICFHLCNGNKIIVDEKDYSSKFEFTNNSDIISNY